MASLVPDRPSLTGGKTITLPVIGKVTHGELLLAVLSIIGIFVLYKVGKPASSSSAVAAPSGATMGGLGYASPSAYTSTPSSPGGAVSGSPSVFNPATGLFQSQTPTGSINPFSGVNPGGPMTPAGFPTLTLSATNPNEPLKGLDSIWAVTPGSNVAPKQAGYVPVGTVLTPTGQTQTTQWGSGEQLFVQAYNPSLGNVWLSPADFTASAPVVAGGTPAASPSAALTGIGPNGAPAPLGIAQAA